MFVDKLQETLEESQNVSVTENGAVGYRTTGKALLDLNWRVSSLRSAGDDTIIQLFRKAWNENPELAMKWLFYARDIRGGMGERRLFRVILKQFANTQSSQISDLLELVPEYGRWDDLWCLLDTKLQYRVMGIIRNQLAADVKAMQEKKPCSLLAKWLPSAKGKNRDSHRMGKQIQEALGWTNKQYNKTLSSLRKYINIVERQMSANQWEDIDYQAVPSRANLIYNSAFLRHDESRRRNFLEAVNKGEKKINSSTLYPHEIVAEYNVNTSAKCNPNLEALWKNLPDTVKGAENVIVVADGSGSMGHRIANGSARALDVANALAIYFAERSVGQFHDKYITFSNRPQLVDLSKGNGTLASKIRIALRHNEAANTNIEAVFDLILKTAVQHHLLPEELPGTILILSDMEFDTCTCDNHSCYCLQPNLFEVIGKRYEDAGYRLPRLAFWNILSRSNTIPIKQNEMGVALISGFSTAAVDMVLSNKLDPYECLIETITRERYKPIILPATKPKTVVKVKKK